MSLKALPLRNILKEAAAWATLVTFSLTGTLYGIHEGDIREMSRLYADIFCGVRFNEAAALAQGKPLTLEGKKIPTFEACTARARELYYQDLDRKLKIT
jgi:hypothetical protein